MKSGGSAIIAVAVGILAIWLFIKLLGFALKLVAVLIGVALAVAVYFVAKRMIAGGVR